MKENKIIENDNQNGKGTNRNLEEGNFQRVPNILINDIKIGKLICTDLGVYCVFSDHQRKKPDSWVSNKTVANHLGMSTKTVMRSLVRLAEAGHLSRNGKTKFGTMFTSLTTRVVDKKVVKNGVVVGKTSEADNSKVMNTESPSPHILAMQQTATPKTAERKFTPYSPKPTNPPDWLRENDKRESTVPAKEISESPFSDPEAEAWREAYEEDVSNDVPF